MGRKISAATRMILCALALLATPLAAETPGPPPGMSDEQFRAVVDAASRAAAERMKSEAAPPPASEAPMDMEREAGRVAARLGALAMAAPAYIHELARLPSVLTRPDERRGLAGYLVVLALSCAAALGCEPTLRALLAGLRRRLADASAARAGLRAAAPVLLLFALDAVGLALVALISYGAVGVWFQGDGAQAQLARGLLVGIFAWRLYMLAFRIVLRPAESGARLVAISEAEALAVYRQTAIVIAVAIALRIQQAYLVAVGAPADVAGVGQIVAAIVFFAFLTSAAARLRTPIASWLRSLARYSDGPIAPFVARRWLAIAMPLIALLLAAKIYGVVLERPSIPVAMVFTINTIVALLLLETLAAHILRKLDAVDAGAQTTTQAQLKRLHDARLSTVALRAVKLAILIGAIALIVPRWTVDVFGMMDDAAWRAARHASIVAALTLFAAFVGWDVISFATRRFIRDPQAVGAEADDSAHAPASRFATIAPLVRIASGILIAVVATLLVLSQLGVNTTPLIAGASVFGLAISFGSQTLVRDIVSGIFYLADDAFRVGEYIDCGRAKGTVEGFTLRSIRLRHQNGQIHTIPFGQLGQITNFSRDWATVKFNLRLARNVDLEKVRKLVKKIGLEMLEDPEVKDEFIEPLKLQGVADIVDNAIIVRLKFTARPNNPAYVQRLAIKRIVQAFPQNGVEFASPTIAVQTFGGASEATIAGAAAAGALAAQTSVPARPDPQAAP